MELSKTGLEVRGKQIRLIEHGSNVVLFELQGDEIDDALRAGLLDAENLHASMFECARLIRDDLSPSPLAPHPEDDAAFLRKLGIRWD